MPTILRAAEREALKKFDFLIAIQRSEMGVLTNWGFGRRVVYSPVTVRQVKKEPSKAKIFGFIGGDMEANLDGINFFLKKVWPFFANFPVKLVIAGKVCEKIAPINFPNVDMLGFVENEDDFFSSIDVLINPVTWGGGLKIKVAQSLGVGVPVIGSSEAAAGCEEAINQGIIIADTPRDFILAVWRMFRDERFFYHQSKAAYHFATKEFSQVANDPLFAAIEHKGIVRHA